MTSTSTPKRSTPASNDPTAPVTIRTSVEQQPSGPTPVILVAHAQSGVVPVDRCAVTPPFTVGRGDKASLQIMDARLSREHLRIEGNSLGYFLEDLGSKNGTRVDGHEVAGRIALPSGSVVKAGNVVLVFYEDGGRLLLAPPAVRHGIDGPFFGGVLLEQLGEAARSARHLLLSGPSGTGKERAVRALAALNNPPGSPAPILAHNAATYATEDEAATSLFGVAARVFSQVDERPGLIEMARGGFLLLDEVHSLPPRLQRSLLRVVEDGLTCRIGEVRTRVASVRFVFASNISDDNCGLVPDLRARLRLVRVPSLHDRRADIPAIFLALLSESFCAHNLDATPAIAAVSSAHSESLCLDGFPQDNVRGLIDLADRITTKTLSRVPPAQAVADVFSERFPKSRAPAPSLEEEEEAGHYERLKPTILRLYRECGGNLSAVERNLKKEGFRCSWRWLATYLRRWGIRTD